MRHRVTPGRAVTALALAVCVAAAGGLTRAPAGQAAAASQPPGDCPPVMRVAEVTRGMTGTALSVVQGTEPSSFDAEVVGVLPNGIAPGRDLIVVNLSGQVIDRTGGLWFGASGSPVYLPDPVTGEQELVGAIAYGLSYSESTLAGLTPAEDMIGLIDPAVTAGGQVGAERIRVPTTLARRMAAAAGVSVAEAASFERLRIPLSVSGLTPRAMKHVRTAIERQDLPFLPFAGSAASETSAEVVELSAGDSFVAAESLGDVTFAGIGTTTFVCYGQAAAFGHPFSWSGETTLAARAADTLTIVRDPVWGSYKLATIGGNAGTVTEDRLAGIAANLGEGPATTPITSTVTDLDSGRTRDGETHAVMPEALSFLSFIHLFLNIDVTIDRIGPGSSQIAFTIAGERANGSPWTLRRTNRYADEFDISFGSVFEVSDAASLLASFPGIRITSIDVSRLDVKRRFEHYQLSRVLVWNGRAYVQRRFVRARPGRLVRLRAVLKPSHLPVPVTVELALRVPAGAKRGGFIEVRGGNQSFFEEVPCFFDGVDCGDGGGGLTFDKALATLANQPRNDVLSARLRLGPSRAVRAQRHLRQDAVVSGSRVLQLKLIR